MSIQLFSHNQIAYDSALEMLEACGKAAIIHPTGTGKSFIGFKLCEENPDKLICWLSPSEYIFKTQLENLANAADGYVPENLVFYTYAKLMNMSETELQDLDPDFIILDEFHRAGAEFWGAGVQELLKIYPEVPILGLSATNIRYLDNRRDMAEELFDGNIASEMTLGEAIVRGILNAPKYVISIFSYQKDLEKYEYRVRNAKSKAVREEGEKYLEALRRALEKADGLDTIFQKHIENKSGKYIVFCANYEHLCEMTQKAPEWFAKIDNEPHIYTAYSDDPATSRAFNDFKKDNSDHLKLLFCIDMFNEGIHVEDVCGVILLRPTVSPIIYKQQIGRALSASKKNNAVIFDIVLNIENLYSVDAIEEEMQIATTYYRSRGLDNEIVTEHFKVIDAVRDCIALFDKLNGTLSASWDLMYEHAKEYYRENGDLDATKRYVTPDGFTLGVWLDTQRKVKAGKVRGILTDAQIKKLEAIGMRWESVRDVAWEKYYSAAKAYYEEHGNLRVNKDNNNYHGVALGRWIAQVRTYRKNNIHSTYLTNERIAMLDSIGMVWEFFDYLWEENFVAALDFYRQNGHLNIPADYNAPNGLKIGIWLRRQREVRTGRIVGSPLTPAQIERLEAIGMNWETKFEAAWNRNYQAAVEYFTEYGNLDVPTMYVAPSGVRLGAWIADRREKGKEKHSLECQQQLDKLGMIWVKPDSWEVRYALVKQYYEKYGDLNIPPKYKANGIWISRWLFEQRQIYRGNRGKKQLTEEQIKRLEAIGMNWENRNHLLWSEAWHNQFRKAQAFYGKFGHLSVPRDYDNGSGKSLAVWIHRQRALKAKGKLTEEQIELLDSIGMIWVLEDPWEIGFQHAKEYYVANGELRVPNNYVCSDGYTLGTWISNQRNNAKGKDKYRKLDQKQIKRLEDIGMVWNVLDDQWQEAFENLSDFYQKNGHFKVKRGKIPEYNFDLLSWINEQRRKYREGELSKEQIAKLESIHFDWLTSEERRFEIYYAAALRYYNENGHLNVPATYVDAEGVALGRWVRKIQASDTASASTAINKDRAARLARIGIV